MAMRYERFRVLGSEVQGSSVKLPLAAKIQL